MYKIITLFCGVVLVGCGVGILYVWNWNPPVFGWIFALIFLVVGVVTVFLS